MIRGGIEILQGNGYTRRQITSVVIELLDEMSATGGSPVSLNRQLEVAAENMKRNSRAATEDDDELIQESAVTIAAVEPAVTIAAVEPAVTIDAVEPAVTIAAVEPAVTIAAVEPDVTIAAVEPAVTIAAVEPAAIIAAVEPAVTIAAVEPAVTIAAVEPAVTIAAVEPAAIIAAVEPAVTIAAVEPAGTTAVEPAGTTAVEPAVTIAAVEPAAIIAAVEPAVTIAAVEPTVTIAAVEPAGTTGTEPAVTTAATVTSFDLDSIPSTRSPVALFTPVVRKDRRIAAEASDTPDDDRDDQADRFAYFDELSVSCPHRQTYIYILHTYASHLCLSAASHPSAWQTCLLVPQRRPQTALFSIEPGKLHSTVGSESRSAEP